VSRDDELLDLLGSGGHPATTDPVIEALYAWRLDLSTGLDRSALVTRNGHRHNGRIRSGTARRDERTQSGEDGTGHRGRHRRRPGQRRSTIAAVAVGLSAGLSGVAVAAADAGPGSPLWPITKVIYSDTAAERQAEADAEAALDRAKQALAEGRVKDAERYLDEANRRAGAVGSHESDKLRDDLDAVRLQIEQKQTDTSVTEPSDTPEAPDAPTDGGSLAPTPEPPAPSTSTGAKDGKGKGGPGGGNRQQSSEDGFDASSPEPTSGDLTGSSTAL
jgi:hypothetical protein